MAFCTHDLLHNDNIRVVLTQFQMGHMASLLASCNGLIIAYC